MQIGPLTPERHFSGYLMHFALEMLHGVQIYLGYDDGGGDRPDDSVRNCYRRPRPDYKTRPQGSLRLDYRLYRIPLYRSLHLLPFRNQPGPATRKETSLQPPFFGLQGAPERNRKRYRPGFISRPAGRVFAPGTDFQSRQPVSDLSGKSCHPAPQRRRSLSGHAEGN